MSNDVTISAPTATAHVTPKMFQYYAKDFFAAFQSYQPTARYSPARLFLLLRSTELAAKSLRLSLGYPSDELKKLGHDLVKCCDVDTLKSCGITITPAEIEEIRKANNYYKDKGFEYFIFKYAGQREYTSGLNLAFDGWPDWPDEQVIESLLRRLLDVPIKI